MRFMMINENRLNQMRAGAAREIRIALLTLFIATAICAAVAACDFENKDYAGFLGNVGLLAILVRMYLTMPRIIAIAKRGRPDWVKAETEYLLERFPYYDVLGKIGWFALFASVFMQLNTVMH